MPNNYFLASDGELYHYGVKGQKWGVRRYQNKDGTLTAAGKKRHSTESANDKSSPKQVSSKSTSALAKRLADRNFSASTKLQKLDEEHDKFSEEYKKKFDEVNAKYRTAKTAAQIKKLDREYDELYDQYDIGESKYSKKRYKLVMEEEKEKTDLRESVFLSDDIKPLVSKASGIRDKLNGLREETVGQSSKAYKDAYKKYVKSLTDPDLIAEAEYGFDHYHWHTTKEYEQAKKAYASAASRLTKEYTDLTVSIGKKITEGFGDQKMSDDWFKDYEDWGRQEADEVIWFERIKL